MSKRKKIPVGEFLGTPQQRLMTPRGAIERRMKYLESQRPSATNPAFLAKLNDEYQRCEDALADRIPMSRRAL